MSHKDTTSKHHKLRRSLKTRHLTMIAIGGSIGTGLFVASGVTISTAGPGGALLSHIIVGLVVYFIMTSLGELSSCMPISGSFAIYGEKYVEEGFGFALGWNYWYNWAITIAVDLVAAQLVMEWWFQNIPGWIWSTLFLSIIFLINYTSARSFGEAEYWFSLIKIITIIIFILIGILIHLGFFKNINLNGWKNWIIEDAPFVGGLSSIIGASIVVGFSFQGTELIGIAAGESENPEKNIPRAIRQVFWRIILFYILAILVISLIIPYTDPCLLCYDKKSISTSPFTLVFQHVGFIFAGTMMNIVIIITMLSAGNSGMYAATRMLYALSCHGKAPLCFSKLSSNGIPRNALYVTTIVSSLCFLTSIFNNKTVYLYLLSISSTTGFIAWIGIAISHYRFRRGYLLQGNNIKKLPYSSQFFPFGPIFSFVLCLIIAFGQRYDVFLCDTIVWSSVIKSYIGIFLFLIIWLIYRLKNNNHFVKYKEMKFSKVLLKDKYNKT